MNKVASIIIVLGLVVGIAVIFFSDSINKNPNFALVENSQIKNGIQYVTISAGGGYFPRVSSAKAGIPTKLIVRTNGAYDCSSALSIPSAGFQKILPQTGETEIDIGIPKLGEPLQGVCGMGMYNFSVNFN